MDKTYFRYFSSFFKTQEKWLNKRAMEGQRLYRTTQGRYFFTSCKANEYEYRVEFIANKSQPDAIAYKAFLEEVGYRVFYKNLNLSYSVGRIKWRPYAKGQIVSSMGRYNKELLIIEKKRDGTPFHLHSDRDDRIRYYKNIRNMYITTLLVLLMITVGSIAFPTFFSSDDSYTTTFVFFLCILLSIPILLYTRLISLTKKESDIFES